ncbi:hypothetical protein [Lentzea jiangxiensis]|uniref:Uncharacterized protein n=1 Tax=Lentzea jiangxiensis TaxID=641025 RepID=A0A1H0DL74_9PSEU|nr:hypothetical protein [Lentzea jiangxiensis]SDN70808.1 hypothetical protein SAMN05421507_10125 [Lentzea jiangxiensis]
MTGVRRRGRFSAAVVVMGAALIAAVLSAPADKPVDIRLVAPPPLPPQVVTATATTTVSAIGAVEPAPPPPPPPPPPRGEASPPPPRHEPRQPPPPPPPRPGKPKPKPPNVFDLLRCDAAYFEDDDFNRCLEWPFDAAEFCELLEKHNLEPVDVRGPGGRRFDRFDVKCDER